MAARRSPQKNSASSAVHVQLPGPLLLRKQVLEATLDLTQLLAHYSAYADVRARRLQVMDKLAKVLRDFKKQEVELADIDLPPLPVEFVAKKTVTISTAAPVARKSAADDDVSRLQKEIAALENQLQQL